MYQTSNDTSSIDGINMSDEVNKCNPDGTFCDGAEFQSLYTSVRTEVCIKNLVYALEI